MSSLKQIEANRLNAKKSTGPRTPEGKANSRFNALKSGIDAGAEAIPGEDPDELLALAAEYYRSFAPRRPEHYALVDDLIASEWLLRRLRKIEGQLWDQEIARASGYSSFDPDTPLASTLSSVENRLTRLQRRMDSAGRAYHRALNQIRRLQEASLKPFDPEPLPEEPAGPDVSRAQPPENQENNAAIGFVPQISVAPGGGSTVPDPKPVAQAATPAGPSVAPAFRTLAHPPVLRARPLAQQGDGAV